MIKVRKKPVVVEAVKVCEENSNEIKDLPGVVLCWHTEGYHGHVSTREGDMGFSEWEGYWIIRGVAGELYPCEGEIFDKTYEKM